MIHQDKNSVDSAATSFKWVRIPATVISIAGLATFGAIGWSTSQAGAPRAGVLTPTTESSNPNSPFPVRSDTVLPSMEHQLSPVPTPPEVAAQEKNADKGVSGSDERLAETPQPVNPPIALDSEATTGKGARFRITRMETIQAEAIRMGEVAGPAIRFEITVDNPTDASVSTTSMLVNVEIGQERVPALQLSGSGATVFPETVPAKASASAIYVFRIDETNGGPVRIFVNHNLQEPIIDFEGNTLHKTGQ